MKAGAIDNYSRTTEGSNETVTPFIEQILFERFYVKHFALVMLNPFSALLCNSICCHCMDQNTETLEGKGPRPMVVSPVSGRTRLSAP